MLTSTIQDDCCVEDGLQERKDGRRRTGEEKKQEKGNATKLELVGIVVGSSQRHSAGHLHCAPHHVSKRESGKDKTMVLCFE